MSNDKVAATYGPFGQNMHVVHYRMPSSTAACGTAYPGMQFAPTDYSDEGVPVTCPSCRAYEKHLTFQDRYGLKGLRLALQATPESVQELADRVRAQGPIQIWTDAEWTAAAEQARTEMRMRDYVALQVSADAVALGPLPIEDQAPVPGPTGKQLLFALGVMALIVLLVSLPAILRKW